ncbi:MAG: hypothetical protein ACKVT0_19715 [Planctomycetaceae bacterium]
MAERSGKGMARQPATKFAHLRKKMSKAQGSKRDNAPRIGKKGNNKFP